MSTSVSFLLPELQIRPLPTPFPGNWLRDYSQAVDVGTLKGVQADTIRILVWVLAFMSFGYATQEFEVSAERLGVYRPEEHIDNPKDYADNIDATQLDPRLRGPVMREELAIDPDTGMKNYIANERGGWATSSAYVKWSFSRSMHFGRLYTHGAQRGRQEDLCEALRCLGQGLHCLEDFGAHTNYTELALRELGYREVFALVGEQTGISLGGKQVFPLVSGWVYCCGWCALSWLMVSRSLARLVVLIFCTRCSEVRGSVLYHLGVQRLTAFLEATDHVTQV